jgi:hypothetical protein
MLGQEALAGTDGDEGSSNSGIESHDAGIIERIYRRQVQAKLKRFPAVAARSPSAAETFQGRLPGERD